VYYYPNTGIPTATLQRFSNLKNINASTITIADYDLFPGKILNVQSVLINVFSNLSISNKIATIVPPIKNGKEFCGPCRFRDRSKCSLFNNFCWTDYMNYTILYPSNTTDCLKAMYKECYKIWKVNGTKEVQCMDFVPNMDFKQMQIKAGVQEAAFSTNGKKITIKFNDSILRNELQSGIEIFHSSTINWLPDSKTIKWLDDKTLEVDYNPQKGILNTMTLKANAVFYNYAYAMEPITDLTFPVLDTH
jgi:hypothetical protein